METLPNSISSFNPTPEESTFIIHAITSRDTTLAATGAHCGVTVETLTAWLATPAIRARLEAADTTICHAIRIRANVLTPLALAAATQIVDDFRTTPTPHSRSIDPGLLAHRRAETARKAAALIVRLTSHQPAHIRRAASPSKPAPAAETPLPVAPDACIQRAHDEPAAATPIARVELEPSAPDQHPIAPSPVPIAQAATPLHDSTDPHPAPDSHDSTPVEQILDLIATLSPEQVAYLSTFGAPLHTADSS